MARTTRPAPVALDNITFDAQARADLDVPGDVGWSFVFVCDTVGMDQRTARVSVAHALPGGFSADRIVVVTHDEGSVILVAATYSDS